ncbi:deoxyribose-phosphate aldolase, variant [Phytophthora nicotianae CJ01A1]|uniref:Deoxyribose-phosphate aldolase, variant n=4 Tax=Phytophthora nicotianae TaxID=4792 RepID=V9FKY7_PHYNI|nr:deoxyribose-phosphate aldolase, variant [Phytophthora nicotianae P1569]ETK90970.1 deoxyribose-phosphate aldolase, variant [Phytophthora nicotianae]ETP20875.1 deoxyribose-phosphate aldolase, variant [Phytophthora nicotianae CJ01A1]ETL44372.1 deoxyribose-phosphate aldolase, variant [Phytophthora nicotianae]ETL97542.1 deoxyribose-phosphate aldolase, variant [Phytophthora nicotianae]
MPAGLTTPFQRGHDVKYGLEVVERDPETSAVLLAACRFCIKFGREANPKGKRKRTTNVHNFRTPFRTDNYKRHHEVCHTTIWNQYLEASDEDKKTFFDSPGIPEVVANNSRTMCQYVDHTLLKAEAQPSHIKTLCEEAVQHSFCSVCVNASYASLARKTLDELKDTRKPRVKVCCVVGFPLGATTTATKVFETQQCLNAGAEEIDMVINVGMLHAKEYDYVLRDICAVVGVCKDRGAISKVILETALLSEEQIRKASELAIAAGTDFIKTSTGYSTRGTSASLRQL